MADDEGSAGQSITGARIRELMGFPPDDDSLLVALHRRGVGRDGLFAAVLPGKLRMGMLRVPDALAALDEVDAFLAAVTAEVPRG